MRGLKLSFTFVIVLSGSVFSWDDESHVSREIQSVSQSAYEDCLRAYSASRYSDAAIDCLCTAHTEQLNPAGISRSDAITPLPEAIERKCVELQ
jgi:hypothetical protein